MAKTNAELLKELSELQASFDKIIDEIEVLRVDNGKLKKDIGSLKNINADLQDSLMSQENPSASGAPLTRNDIIKGLLPSLSLSVHDTEAHVGNLLNCADILLKKING